MSGRRWLRAASDTQWVLAVADVSTGVSAIPTVSFSVTSNGSVARVDATGSFSTNGPITSYKIDFGDGYIATTKTAEHSYGTPNTYAITVSLTDSTGRSATAVQTVQVGATTGNVKPTAQLAVSATGLTAQLDASASTDPDGRLVSYRFTFGDSTPYVTSASPTVSHTYAKDGSFVCTVTVTDDSGATSASSKTVTVAKVITAPPPTTRSTGLVAFGDSLTWGDDGTGSRVALPWPAILNGTTQLPVTNAGVSGYTSLDEGVLQGGVNYAVTLPNNTLPGSRSTPLPLTRSGQNLQVAGQTVKLAGANAYWLGLDDNAGGVTFPSKTTITNAIAGMKTMGVGLVRAHTVGMSAGTSQSFETAPGTFVDANLDAADWAVYQAGLAGLYLMVPLTDNWNYYHGGKWNFVHWAYQQNSSGFTADVNGQTKDDVNERVFFANTAPGLRVRALFKAYISAWLNHVNPYTGLAYKDDPTIAIVETGNEVYYAAQLGTNEWTQDIASYIKGIAPGKLVADGSAADRVAVSSAPGLTAASVDIVGAHYYPQTQSGSYPPAEFNASGTGYPAGTALQQLAADASAAVGASKAFIVGEYPWTRSSVASWYSALQNTAGIDGSMYWSYVGGAEVHGGAFGSDDYAVHQPYANATESQYGPALVAHTKAMQAANPTPPNTPAPVKLAAIQPASGWKSTTALHQSYTGTLAGVVGTLTRSGTTGSWNASDWNFTRAAAGSSVSVPAGSTFHCTSYDAKVTADEIIWLGLNDASGGTSTGINGAWQTPLLANLRKMVARSTGRALVIGLHPVYNDATWKAKVIAWNTQAAAAFGGNFLDIYAYLSSVTPFQDLGLTPTGQDTTDIGNGWVPQTFRGSDGTHFSATGYRAIAVAIKAKIDSLGWLGDGTVGGGTSNYVIPWTTGTWDQGLPSSVVVVPYQDLYQRLSTSQRTDEDVVGLAIDQLAAHLSSKGLGASAVVKFPSGFDGLIPGFRRGSANAGSWTGITSQALIGFLGGVTNGVLQARLRMKANSMTQEQLTFMSNLSTSGNSAGSYTTNQTRAIRFPQSKSLYVMGMQFDGADMQTITDYRETGPAPWGGMAVYRPGDNSIIQNSLFRGFGKSDSSSPPGEVAQIDLTRDVRSILRRVEVDGRTPAGDRRAASVLWSGSVYPTAEDCYLHDSYVSGPSFSFAGSIALGNLSSNVVTRRMRSEDNANHKGNVSGYRFAPVNHEHPQTSVLHDQGLFGLDDSTRNLWDSCHMTYTWNPSLGGQGGLITVADPVVLDADRGGAYAGDNGCFSIKAGGWSTQQNYLQEPVVTVGGRRLIPWVRTGAGQAPSYVTPDAYFIYKHQN